MNRRTRTILGIISAFSLLLFLGAIAAIAHSGYTSECGECHTINASYTISSNSTGEAYLGNPFTLRIDASKPSVGGTDLYVSVQNGWADNDNFTFTPTEIQDNEAGDLYPTKFRVICDFTFTAKSLGSYTIRVWSAAVNGSQSLDIPIEVKDPVPPTIDSPPDMEIVEGNLSASATWNPSDAYPDRYEVLDNGVLFSSGSWNGSSISVGLGTLSAGTHNLTIIVYDDYDNMAVDQVNVLVLDKTLPVINHLDNSTISQGAFASLTWTCSDLHPSSYDVYREGVLVDTDVWVGGSIVVSLAGVSLGEHNYTLVVFDASGNTAKDTTFVTLIDDTNPSIDHPPDMEYSEGSIGNSIVWNASDLNPSTFTIYRNKEIIRFEAWNGDPIIEPIDGLVIAVYNFTIVVTDTSGNSISDEVLVTVIFPPEPTIDHPSDQIIPEGSIGNIIDWSPIDLDPSTYEIFLNNVLVKSGLWNSSSETISISIDGLSIGIYEFTIIVYDLANHTTSDLVIVTVYDNTTPKIDSPMDIAINEGDVDEFITWTPSDLNPVSYEIFLDGTLMKKGLWNSSSEVIIASCDGLAYGTHIFMIIVNDVGDNSIFDEVIVSVLDGSAPIVDSPPDIVYQVSTTGHNITWTPSDAHPSEFTIQVNGVIILSGGWDGQQIIINIDWLSVGTYEYALTVADEGGNTISDIVIVTVTEDDSSATTTTSITTGTGDSPGTPDDDMSDAVTFGMLMLSMGIIAGILILGLILDKRGR